MIVSSSLGTTCPLSIPIFTDYSFTNLFECACPISFDTFGSILVHTISFLQDRFLLGISGYSFIPSLAAQLIEPASSPLLPIYTSKYPQLHYHRGNMASCLKTSESVVCVVFDKGSIAPSISSNVVDFLSKQNVLLHLIDDSLAHGFLCNH